MADLSKNLLRTHSRHILRTTTTPVFRGVRVANDLDCSVLECARAALLLYPDGVLSGYTAAYLHGAAYTADKPTEITLSHSAVRNGIVIRRARLSTDDVIERRGLRYTTAARTVVDLARFQPGDEAVAAVDQMLRKRRYRPAPTTIEAVTDHLDRIPSLHRGTRVREVLAEADGRAESPWETYTRLLLHRSDLGMFVPQEPIRDGRIRVDLGAAAYGVAVEYDGEYHRDSTQHKNDVERWNVIQFDEGWSLVLATSSTITSERELFLSRVRRALLDRGWTPGAIR